MAAHKQMSAKHTSTRTSQVLMQELTATGQRLNATNADFLKIDVKTALTFSGLALETDNQEKKQRNRKHARQAYDTILHLSKNVTFTPSEEVYMIEMMGRLKNDLALLEENL
jgi:hypothetical protein